MSNMATYRKKYKKKQPYKRMTGEDIAMLREKNREGGLKANSSSYKDNIDGA
jgi:hypothetical protein